MTLVVETGQGVAGSESYASIAFADDYHAKRGDPAAWAEIKAVGILTLAVQPLDAETFSIGLKTYTLQTVLVDVDGNIKIGADVAATRQNIFDAINGTTANADVAPSTVPNVDVLATGISGNNVNLEALILGDAGNQILLAETFTDSGNTVSGASLAGGDSKITDKEFALREATEYLDAKYQNEWIGQRLNELQTLAWPRIGAQDPDGFVVGFDSVPLKVQQATAILALKAIGGEELLPDLSSQGSITRKKVKVGSLEQDLSFSGSGTSQLKNFSKVTKMLRDLIGAFENLRRA